VSKKLKKVSKKLKKVGKFSFFFVFFVYFLNIFMILTNLGEWLKPIFPYNLSMLIIFPGFEMLSAAKKN